MISKSSWLRTLIPTSVILCGGLISEADAPPIGWTVHCKVVQVYDGDTVVVEIRKRVRVRLLDCWAPEVRTKDAAEKKRGNASKANLQALLPEGSDAILHIPGSVDIGRSLTFGRFLGHMWSDAEDDNVSVQQVAAGHATEMKKR